MEPPALDGDPAPLFTPTKMAPTTQQVETMKFPKRLDFVLVPHLSAEEKKLYKAMPEDESSDSNATLCDEIIGEWRDQTRNVLFYYARYKQGLAHKHREDKLEKWHPTLINIYKRRKAEGSLPPFDPSSEQVHYDSRVRTTLRISKSRAVVSVTSSPLNSDAADYEEEEETDDDSEENDSDALRRSKRSKPLRVPFSPRKTRSQRLFIQPSDGEDEEDEVLTLRRSIRGKPFKVNLRDASSVPSDDEPGPEVKSKQRSKTKAKAPKKRVAPSRPAYGYIRPVEELEAEYDDDEYTILHRHRVFCEKCHEEPTHILLETGSKKLKGRGRARKRNPDDEPEDSADELDKIAAKGGWVRCLKCPVAAHWRCLTREQSDDILKAARERDRAAWLSTQPADVDVEKEGPKKRSGLEPEQTTDFICGSCTKGGFCVGCMEEVRPPELKDISKSLIMPEASALSDNQDDILVAAQPSPSDDPEAEFIFRCLTCKRPSHYHHLPKPASLSSGGDIADVAQHYQEQWLCGDCVSLVYPVDKILAWRAYPPHAVEPPLPDGQVVNYKNRLPREYLVKWAERSYRRTTWVPHMWLVSINPSKLRNFLSDGPKVELLHGVSDHEPVDDEPSGLFAGDSRDTSEARTPTLPNVAIPDAESRIPPNWKIVDRVLDVIMWSPKNKRKTQKNVKGKRKAQRVSSEDEGSEAEDFSAEYEAVFDTGEQPGRELTQTLEHWERNNTFGIEHANLVVWAFIKWQDLGYDEATWDSPPRPSDPTYPAFANALKRFIAGREVRIPKFSKTEMAKYEQRPLGGYKKHRLQQATDLDLGQAQELKLMGFQVEGFNWLCDNWWNKQPCILADEMGLGKTVQIASFIGYVATSFQAFPALVVVPNSTITNWIREFERWAPTLRVVPFHGEAKAREVIKQYELDHDFHVLVATYETLLNAKDFTSVFKARSPWKILVIDEGQRIKSDRSLLFRKLNDLRSMHRILMTGTPLNNNIRELFNLMNFLDAENWNDLEGLEKEYEELTESLVRQLHERLRPYFLRRLKSEVLQLPPKNEVIVPVSMSPLQKEVYRSILSHNADLLNGLAASATKVMGSGPKTRINNVLMQLRKCLQHPYLYAEDIEPGGLSPSETHEKLIDASAKLRLLKVMLPKLKARGHRVLLFSQFVLALNIVEDFLTGEGLKYLRLDGNTKGSDRQKGMDEFNKPGSDVFIYILSTRAGGVGINLFSADTVIVFDPDFNPHQDLQAIARAYRFGQKKTCLVFKLMVKGSAEERIMQIGKKKLVLDHLIVQKMDDEEDASENMQSILTYGAQALFDADQSTKDITYSDNDIDALITKTEQPPEGEEKETEASNPFSFAKVWTADKEVLEDLGDEDQGDSWADTLQKITTERIKIQIQDAEISGRGARRRAAKIKNYNYGVDDSPEKPSKTWKGKKKATSASSEGSAYNGSEAEDSEATSEAESNAPIASTDSPELCGLCGDKHASGACIMAKDSKHLCEYRFMLLMHADDEPLEERRQAIDAIDDILLARGDQGMVVDQPLHLVEKKSTTKMVSDKQAGPSTVRTTLKRPISPSPTQESQIAKKAKQMKNCPICSGPQHELEQCPTVMLGSKSVAKEILRLDNIPGMSGTVHTLRRILSHQKRLEAGR